MNSLPPAATQSSLWSHIDAVLVLNLDHRTERWDKLKQETAGIIPAEKLHRVSAVLGRELPGFARPPWFRGRKRDATWAARGGCVLAHRRALETARNAGWNVVLILEDDVGFDPAFASCFEPLRAALFDSALEWDVCYPGYTDPLGPFQTLARLDDSHHLARVFGCNCAHAYLVKARVRDWALSQLPDESTIWSWLAGNRAVDRWYRKVLGQRFRVFAVSPSLVNQSAGFSDIVGRGTNYLDEGGHQLSVPETTASSAFGLRYFFKIQRSRISRIWDQVRSVRKRLAGF